MLSYSWRSTRVMFLLVVALAAWVVYLGILVGANQGIHLATVFTGGVPATPSDTGLFVLQTQLASMPFLLALPYFVLLGQSAAQDGAAYDFLLTRPVRRVWFVWSQWLVMAAEVFAAILLGGGIWLLWLYFVHGPVRAILLAELHQSMQLGHLTAGHLAWSFLTGGGLWWLIGIAANVLMLSGGMLLGGLYRRTRTPGKRRLAALVGLLGFVPLLLGMIGNFWTTFQAATCDCGHPAAFDSLHPWAITARIACALAWPLWSTRLLQTKDL